MPGMRRKVDSRVRLYQMLLRLVSMLILGEVFEVMKEQGLEELEHEVLEAKERFRAANDEAFRVCKEYRRLEVMTGELREECLGLCGVMKANNGKPCGHLTGLILLKNRMREAYRDIRGASLRTLRRSVELLAKANRLYREYMSLKKTVQRNKGG